MSIVIRIEKLSKAYNLGALDGRSFLEEWRRKLFSSKRHKKVARFWALRDVTFDVRDGEVIGILGKNGAGKSTLLKLLSSITSPTLGRIRIKGRVASLLEVGTGFHPELTGRENVFLNGAILGMNRKEVASRFDEIAAFADIGVFLDTPVKRYSSGMRMRLAFAVAAHLKSEILILDEVLAVGDDAFQRKCLAKITALARSGQTVFLVAHQAATVESLCTRGIVFEKGRVAFDGTPAAAIAYYYAHEQVAPTCLRDRLDREGSGEVRLTAVELRDAHNRVIETVPSGGEVSIRFSYERRPEYQFPRLAVVLKVTNAVGIPVFSQSNWFTGQTLGELPERGVLVCHVPRLTLPKALYRVETRLMSEWGTGTLLDGLNDAFDLQVVQGDFFGSGKVPPAEQGVLLQEASWSVETAPQAVLRVEPAGLQPS